MGPLWVLKRACAQPLWREKSVSLYCPSNLTSFSKILGEFLTSVELILKCPYFRLYSCKYLKTAERIFTKFDIGQLNYNKICRDISVLVKVGSLRPTCFPTRMVIARDKCISPSLYWVWAALHIVCFSKRHESYTRVILLLGFGLGYVKH